MDVHFTPQAAALITGRAISSRTPRPASAEDFHQVLEKATKKPDKIADTARQFEALVVGQVLKAAREASQGGWLGTGGDEAGELALEVAEQGFAQALAARGGLGIAKLVTPLLERAEAKAANSEPSAPQPAPQPSKGSPR